MQGGKRKVAYRRDVVEVEMVELSNAEELYVSDVDEKDNRYPTGESTSSPCTCI